MHVSHIMLYFYPVFVMLENHLIKKLVLLGCGLIMHTCTCYLMRGLQPEFQTLAFADLIYIENILSGFEVLVYDIEANC